MPLQKVRKQVLEKVRESTFKRHIETLRTIKKTVPLYTITSKSHYNIFQKIILRYRRQKKVGILKREHEKKLIEIGFPFEAQKFLESTFKRHIETLCTIKKTTPLHNITKKSHYNIYMNIIQRYRRLRKKGILKREHEKKLIEIGFPFEPVDRLISNNKKPSFRKLQELKKRIAGKTELNNDDMIVMQKVCYFMSHYEKETPYVFDEGNILMGKDNFESIAHQDLALFQTFIKDNAHFEKKHFTESKTGAFIDFKWRRSEKNYYSFRLGYARNPNDRPQRKAEMMVFRRCVGEMKVEPSRNEIKHMACLLGLMPVDDVALLKLTGGPLSDDVTIFEKEDDDMNEEATVACSIVADEDTYNRLLHCIETYEDKIDSDLDDEDKTDGDLDDEDKTDGDVQKEMPHDLQQYIQEVTNDVNLVLNKTVEHTNFSIDGTVPPLPLTAEEVDHLHGKAIGTVRKTEHLLEQWKVSSYAHALSTGRETVEYPGVPVEEKVLSPPLTLEEVNGVYDRAIETLKKNEHLLTEWKASWDTQTASMDEVDYPGVQSV